MSIHVPLLTLTCGLETMLRGVPAQIGVENGRVSDQLIFDLFFKVLKSVPELVLHVFCCESGAGLDLCGLGQATIPR